MATTLKTCYDPSGAVTDDIPCDPIAQTSACCSPGGRCVNNLYCVTEANANTPGSCTDPGWGTGCPCSLQGAINYLDTVTMCSYDTYVCRSNFQATCSSNASPVISYGNPNIIPYNTWDEDAMAAYYAGLRVSTAGSGGVSTVVYIPSATTLATSTTSSTATETATTAPSGGISNDLKLQLGLGIGLGVPLLVVLVGIVVWRCSRGGSGDGQPTIVQNNPQNYFGAEFLQAQGQQPPRYLEG